ncbi:bZIP transcription factor 27 isoform X2 [Cajanus cajan]|uniref:bZIP transcription factor 27 isoform X2 n=1 Tax=Cajanus cajan TaxID=3821 RepID=UPI00098DD393|nr:bZIP transcription factor 27 isoform X2 [Cajanus cajan]
MVSSREHKPSSSSHKPIMEDVWEDIDIDINININLNLTHAASKAAKFQDFLARPSPPPSPLTALSLATRSESHIDPLAHNDLKLALLPYPSKAQPQPFPNRTPTCDSSKRPLTCAAASGDTRNVRLMKNRESAARSRARKQAYEFELRQKIKQLQEENARLRRQQQLVDEN